MMQSDSRSKIGLGGDVGVALRRGVVVVVVGVGDEVVVDDLDLAWAPSLALGAVAVLLLGLLLHVLVAAQQEAYQMSSSSLKSSCPFRKYSWYFSMMYLTWFRFSLESSSLFSKIDLILLQMAQKESKSSFQKCRFFAQYVNSGILFAIFQQYLTEILTLLSQKLSSSISSKGILQILHSQPGVMFQFLQLRQTFFSLKQRLGWAGLTTVVRFMSFLRIRDIFFFSFSSLSSSSSAYQLLNRMGWQPRLYSWSSSISRYSGVFCLVCVFMCCIICERICSFIFSAYSAGRLREATSYREKSVGESLSLERSQSNLSLMTVFSSTGMSMSMDTSFLSSVSLRSPSFGRLSRSLWRSSLLQTSMMNGCGSCSSPWQCYSIIIQLYARSEGISQYIQYIVMFIYRLAARGSEVMGFGRLRYGIISNLFKKRNQAEAEVPKESVKAKEEQEREMEDEEYNFFERRKEIDTGLDFSKLREMNTTYIPEDLGKGGIEEVLYWSQNVSTPEQIRSIVTVFNKVASQKPVSQYQGNVQLQQFKASVINTVYLVNSLQGLHEYSLFAMGYEIRSPEFWEKVQFKCLKFVPKSEEEVSYLVDVAFVMGRFQIGEEIFNFIQKMLAEASFSIDQSIKLFLVFSSLKKGEKLWIEKLLQGIADNIHEADAEQLAGVLQNLKEAKKLPSQMNERVEKRVENLVDQLTLPQLLNITAYFGFEHDNEEFWKKLQVRCEELLKDRRIGSKTLDLLIHKCMLTYKFSTDFIRKYIAKPLQAHPSEILQKLTPRALSALSKGLYIYELQGETGHIEQQIGKLIIGKITQQINEIGDEQLIKVIQDYNLTRHGNRELYIFFEQVIKVKFIRHYNPELNRNTLELLIEIYKNSGMCSREMFDSLQNLILQ